MAKPIQYCKVKNKIIKKIINKKIFKCQFEKKVKVLVAQSYPSLCDPMDCSPPGSSVHGSLQARTVEWVAIYSSRGSLQPSDRTLCCRQILNHLSHQDIGLSNPNILFVVHKIIPQI